VNQPSDIKKSCLIETDFECKLQAYDSASKENAPSYRLFFL